MASLLTHIVQTNPVIINLRIRNCTQLQLRSLRATRTSCRQWQRQWPIAAFDTINHNILLRIISNWFRVTGIALNMLTSYLTRKWKRIKVIVFHSWPSFYRPLKVSSRFYALHSNVPVVCSSRIYQILTKLHCIHNRLAHLVTKSPPFTRSVPLLRSLHWLPVRFRILFKISLLTYKKRPYPWLERWQIKPLNVPPTTCY